MVPPYTSGEEMGSDSFEWTDSTGIHHTFSYRYMIINVVKNLRDKKKTQRPRWALVSDAFAIGSQGAQALCRDIGLDPDEIIKP
jgi:hypothetical protein